MINKIVGKRRPDCGIDLYVDGKKLDPAVSQKIHNHSPDGFNAGYGGSGCAQSALGILIEVVGPALATKHYQDFKWEFIAKKGYLDNDFEFEVNVIAWIQTRGNDGNTEMPAPRLFPTGQILSTPGALDLMDRFHVIPSDLLARHQRGDYGQVCIEDKAANDRALIDGTRLVSSYELQLGHVVLIITEADREVTTFLLPSEY